MSVSSMAYNLEHLRETPEYKVAFEQANPPHQLSQYLPMKQ